MYAMIDIFISSKIMINYKCKISIIINQYVKILYTSIFKIFIAQAHYLLFLFNHLFSTFPSSELQDLPYRRTHNITVLVWYGLLGHETTK